MTPERKLKRGVILALSLAAALFITSRIAFRVGFLFLVAALACLMAALMLVLYLPWHNPSWRKGACILRRALYVCLAVGLASFIMVQGLIISGWPDNESVDADCLIVLGAGINGDKLSWVLSSRVELALSYLHEHPNCVVIVSGGQGPGETITEALAMQRYFVTWGIDESRIFMEDRATSTVENLRFSREILEEKGLLNSRIAIVSNSFHLYRARWLADYMGLEAQTLGARTPHFPLTPLNSYLREYCSIMLMYVKAIIGTL